jgi:hypothetical protein
VTYWNFNLIALHQWSQNSQATVTNMRHQIFIQQNIGRLQVSMGHRRAARRVQIAENISMNFRVKTVLTMILLLYEQA